MFRRAALAVLLLVGVLALGFTGLVVSSLSYDASDPRARPNAYISVETAVIDRPVAHVFRFVQYEIPTVYTRMSPMHERFEILGADGLAEGAEVDCVEGDEKEVVRNRYVVTEVVPERLLAMESRPTRVYDRASGELVAEAGLFIASIGPEQVRWLYGTDGAFTLIPNYLATGLAAIAVSLAIVAWCLLYLRRRYGAAGFLGLFVLLTLVGGGIGHVVFYTTAWAFATRMHGRLGWWERVLRPPARRVLSGAWLPALATSSLLFLLALEISVFGYVPGVRDPDAILAVIWTLLLGSLAALVVAYVAAFARDLGPVAAGSVRSRGAGPSPGPSAGPSPG